MHVMWCYDSIAKWFKATDSNGFGPVEHLFPSGSAGSNPAVVAFVPDEICFVPIAYHCYIGLLLLQYYFLLILLLERTMLRNQLT